MVGFKTASDPKGVRPRRLPVLVLFPAGCGGSVASDNEAPSNPYDRAAAATRADLVADAKNICARMEDRVAGLATPSTPPTPSQMLEIIDAWDVTIDELHGLDPPAAEATRFGRMLKHFDKAISAARAMPDTQGEMALVPIAAMADEGMKGGTIAHAYGLDECSLFPPAPTQAEFERYILEQARKEGGLLAPGTLTNPPGGTLEERLPKPKKRS
jgi:hypothetical protein